MNSPFTKNMFIVNHLRKHRFVSVPKVGCTTLKLITSEDDKLWNHEKHPRESIHKLFGYEPDGKRLVPIDSDSYSDYTSVAVFRDPVSRFQSWYKDKIRCVNHPYLKMCGFENDNSVERCLQFLEFELTKSNPEWIEEHVRPQHLIYDGAKIDLLVNLEDMSLYLQEIGVDVKSTKSNSTGNSTLTLSKEQILRINSLYKNDRILSEVYHEKVWHPISA